MIKKSEDGHISCKKCSNSIKHPRSGLCDKCYRQEYKTRGVIKPCEVCAKETQLCKNKCHSCYERARREEIIVAAELDPEKATQLKEYYRVSYEKSKAKGNNVTLKRRSRIAIRKILTRDPSSDLTQDWIIENIYKKNCTYCGIDEDTALKITGQRMHIEQKIPKGGYTISNCTPACKACNTAKLDIWSYEEALEIGKVMSKLYQDRKDKELILEKNE